MLRKFDRNVFQTRVSLLIGRVCLSVLVMNFVVDFAKAEDMVSEQTTAKYQTTYNWQWHPSFSGGPSSSVNSLSANSERMYTFSATAHLGMRLWEGAEAYINPEIASGLPFSGGVVGLGSFTNGEITRSAGTDPKLYLQRLFLRQTWNGGGGSERVEADFNQIAGQVDKNRFVLTAGNFSTLDVFDRNAYAKDPRTQFMNWGSWTYAAYDYAADARGFGWGFAGEWYQNDWVLRFGRMTAPRVPNGLALDPALNRHYGDQVEIEKAYTLGALPGKLRILGWRNRAVLASFDDATAYLLSHPDANPQTILNVRQNEKIKYGLGINVEQALSEDIGMFLRVMKADGKTETQGFTEVDQSLATGLLLRGAMWGRASDSVGLALLINGLSPERRRYLAAGGLSFFIGDGSLKYRPETIVESFYSLGLMKNVWLTGGYQYIQNPAYNAERGPVNVLALRFHAEY